ncbi:zinc ribbon domain-containing protein [Nakamurella deserti]|uniref:zinc ribbon domain-containing protein n=1 Tax=Nakamurella deserti TaxID=2164074 RepID=UPI000DBE30A3|nr:zinc ribbon domain-containing protein [Nakamurella deserti]
MNHKLCTQCGERNEPTAEFCVACLAFLPWSGSDADDTVADSGVTAPAVGAAPRSGDATTVLDLRAPTGPTRHPVAGAGAVPGPVAGMPPTDRTADRPSAPAPATRSTSVEPLRVSVDAPETLLPPDGAPAVVTARLFNASGIVDGFAVELLRPPPWVTLRPVEVRLMPDATADLAVQLHPVPAAVAPAGRHRLALRIRSAADPSVSVPLPVVLVVPPNHAPLTLSAEPSVVRVRDGAEATLVVTVDNAAGNAERRAVLRGTDPERLVRFGFRPPAVDVAPGGRAHVRVSVTAPAPEPGRELSRMLTLAVDGPGRPVTVTLLQSASAAPVDRPYELELTPQLLRLRDTGYGRVRVVVDNKAGVRPLRITLTAADPESSLRFAFRPPVVDVPRGGEAGAELHLEAAPPGPGQEVHRPYTVTGWDGEREIGVEGALVLSTSPPPPDRPLAVRLDPSVVRVRDASSGELAVVADNRGGGRSRSVTFGAFDPERTMRFEFRPPSVAVPAGAAATVALRVSAPRGAGGEQAARPFTVVATDGAAETEAPGSFIQEFSDRRPLWRSVLTVGGGALAVAGAFLPWHVGAGVDVPSETGIPVGSEITGVEWGLPTVEVAAGNTDVGLALPDLPDQVDPFVSAGAVLMLLAVLAVFGRLGPTGRLTRVSALLALLLLGGFLVAAALVPDTGRLGIGGILAAVGCVAMFTGGLLARPRR